MRTNEFGASDDQKAHTHAIGNCQIEYCKKKMPMARLAIIYLLLTVAFRAQANPPEPTGELIADDAHYRVSRVTMVPGAQVVVKQNGHDVVLVVPASARITLASSVDSPPEDIGGGQVRFLKTGSKAAIGNPTDKTGQALVVELKQHW
ncbi:MAG: hypothetical protein WBX03_05005, partial [Terriglobales bacterium]